MLFFGGVTEATHNYVAPTLADMRTRLARALRDEGSESFHNDDLNDYIAAAMVEVSRVYPREVMETFDLFTGTYDYPTQCDYIFRVERLRDGVPCGIIESAGSKAPTTGFDLFSGHIFLPTQWAIQTLHDSIRVWGYSPRNAPGGALGDNTRMDVDQEAEQGVRTFAMLEAYQALTNDRGRFAQWNALPSNTDVTMAQMEALLAQQQQHWDGVRKRLARARRT